MRTLFVATMAGMAVVIAVQARTTNKPAASHSVVFTHVTVIDMTGGPLKVDTTVLVIGDRIARLGKAESFSMPKGVEIVDGSGKFLIPGLWDMHVHLEISGKDASFPMYIANGVTGIRDMGGDIDHIRSWRNQAALGSLVAPRIVAAGPILDGKTPGWPLRITVEDAADAKRTVASLKKKGVDFIKVHNLLSRDAYFAIAAEAKNQGLPFAGHVPVAVTATEAANAGQRSIEHLSGLPSTYDDDRARTLFRLFVKNATWQCPTLTALRSLASLNDADFTSDPRTLTVPSSVKESWDFQIDKFFKSRTPDAIAAAKASVAGNILGVGALHRAGVGILAGTDVGAPYTFPGSSLHDELELLVRSGLSPMEALQAATRNPAKYLGLLHSLGTVEKGKLADLLLLDKNPLDDIANTRSVSAVVLNGRLFRQPDLQKMLTAASGAALKK